MAELEEYPKWLHFDGEASVLVQDEDAEAAALNGRDAPAKSQAPDDSAQRLAEAQDALQAAHANTEHLAGQIDGLAVVLMTEFGGPAGDESATEMAVRVLREQAAELTALKTQPLPPAPKTKKLPVTQAE